ncbi:PD-(D/E)XK nuclease family protein [Halobium palmae]|uniref:PD-(D/E)XK nuclease family protein n=1 Tax=Halobium palmae TaxID=1776492 RepID=A0ABD5RV69_9EURY
MRDHRSRISTATFNEWYQEREFAQNIRNGTPYFNGPSPVPDPERHSPSNLLQCHRKIYYRQLNAPKEDEDPEGIFWTGRRFEEDIIVPYLQDAVVGEDTYVRNSMWIDTTVETEVGELRFKGSTDPVIVDRESEPLLVTEVKTTTSLDQKTETSTHHRAQVHAYMRGLLEKYDRDVDEAVVIYGDRDSMMVKAFQEPFDVAFWNRVVEWAVSHTDFRVHDDLPPGTPEQDWECKFCPYRRRCGKTSGPFQDEGPRGFLPLMDTYPREQVVEYLNAYEGNSGELTPTLAHQYPELAEEYDVREWRCSRCDSGFEWNEVKWDGDTESPPMCPVCLEKDEPREMSG